jgi:hypothetical protein
MLTGIAMKRNLNTKKSYSFPVWAYLLIISIIVIWALTPLINIRFFSGFSQSADIGNSFGSVGALFSGLALAFMAITLFLQNKELQFQREELSLQRQEIKLNREEMHAQTEQFQKQNETLQIQKFENTFFQMITLHHEIVRGISFSQGAKQFSARECFKVLHYYFSNKYNIDKRNASLQETLRCYDALYKEYQLQLGHYFRNLYHIFKFIDKSTIQGKEAYTAILIAQLSSHELALLFYNCIHSIENANFKLLVEKYAVLKNMDNELVFNQEHLKEYSASAYGN